MFSRNISPKPSVIETLTEATGLKEGYNPQKGSKKSNDRFGFMQLTKQFLESFLVEADGMIGDKFVNYM